MANITVTKQVLENGSRYYVANYQMAFDGTGTLVSYLAADPTSTGDMGVPIAGQTLYPGTHLKIIRLRYNLSPAYGVALTWDASAPQTAWTLYGFGKENFRDSGGLFVPQSAGAPITGATGKIFFNSIPATAPAAGLIASIEMVLQKDIAQ